MSDGSPTGAEPDPEPTPAEHRLAEVLTPLREDPPAGSPGTALAVVSRARWQRPLRNALQTATRLVAAVGDAIGLALGRRRGHGAARRRADG